MERLSIKIKVEKVQCWTQKDTALASLFQRASREVTKLIHPDLGTVLCQVFATRYGVHF